MPSSKDPAHNPSAADPAWHDLDSRIAVAGHPVHAMLVAFPIAGVFATAFADVAYWWTSDPFWVRAALWASGGAFAMGCVAALSGLGEMVFVPGVRRRAAVWSHAVAAMVLMRAIFDVVLIETVGVGQSETDVVGVADTVVFCVQPGSGDGLQFMKAGIVEFPTSSPLPNPTWGPWRGAPRPTCRAPLILTGGMAGQRRCFWFRRRPMTASKD